MYQTNHPSWVWQTKSCHWNNPIFIFSEKIPLLTRGEIKGAEESNQIDETGSNIQVQIIDVESKNRRRKKKIKKIKIVKEITQNEHDITDLFNFNCSSSNDSAY